MEHVYQAFKKRLGCAMGSHIYKIVQSLPNNINQDSPVVSQKSKNYLELATL